MTQATAEHAKRQLVRKLYQLAERYGVEEIEPREIVYAVEAWEARGETPETVAKFLWG
jgi:hypothetical protein